MAELRDYLVFFSFSIRDKELTLSAGWSAFSVILTLSLSYHHFLCLLHSLGQMDFFPGGQIKRITALTVTMQYAASRHFLPCNAAKKCQRLPSSLSSDYVVQSKQTHFLINLTVNPF